MKKRVSILLVILWMIVIFIMSSFNAKVSGEQSSLIVNFIANLFNISNTETISFIIRKLAHLTEYFILGYLVSNMLRVHNKRLYLGIIICLLYAASDEIHQLFVYGRSGQVTDVLIDTVGSLMAITLFYIFKKKHIIN